jgi:hypothetical protein
MPSILPEHQKYKIELMLSVLRENGGKSMFMMLHKCKKNWEFFVQIIICFVVLYPFKDNFLKHYRAMEMVLIPPPPPCKFLES